MISDPARWKISFLHPASRLMPLSDLFPITLPLAFKMLHRARDGTLLHGRLAGNETLWKVRQSAKLDTRKYISLVVTECIIQRIQRI